MLDVATGQVKREIVMEPATQVRSLNWADNETLLIELGQTRKAQTRDDIDFEIYRTIAADISGGDWRMLLFRSGDARGLVNIAPLVAWRLSQPKTVIMWTDDVSLNAYKPDIDTRLGGHREDSAWVGTLFQVDTRTGQGKAIEQGSQFTDQWVVDATGKCIARADWYRKDGQLHILARQKAGWNEIYRTQTQDEWILHGLTADGSAIVADGPSKDGRAVAWAISLDGSGAKILYEDPVSDVEDVEVDPSSSTAIGARLGGPTQGIHWFDPVADARFQKVARAFKGRTVRLLGHSDDNQRVLARVFGPSSAPVVYLVDFTTHRADIVGEEYPGLVDVPLGEVRAISYTARDGTAIPAYLTLPPGANAKGLPLVVMPHGGPESRDENDFDWWSQFLASRGYAVLRPQFRGSTGFGDAFRLAGRKQWGGLMQDDVTDGVRAMIDQGIADAKRVCIVGASYGGFAALAGAAFTPDLYKCAVSVGGITDLPDIIGREKFWFGRESDTAAEWDVTVGSPFDKAVIENSPARAAGRIHIPILLIHGENDTVVPIAQSEKMARELGKLAKPVTFVRLKGEDHWLSRGETRLQVLKEIEKFLAANL
jgi:pimeloyl-ACP methyl ester carboxylesterase